MRIRAILIAFLITMSSFSMAQAATGSPRQSSGKRSHGSRSHKKNSSHGRHRSHSAKTKSGNVT